SATAAPKGNWSAFRSASKSLRRRPVRSKEISTCPSSRSNRGFEKSLFRVLGASAALPHNLPQHLSKQTFHRHGGGALQCHNRPRAPQQKSTHSITSAAIASSDGGTTRSSMRAVCILITSSNLF